jgi:hypothetical protein
MSCQTGDDGEHTLVDLAAGDRVLVAAANVSAIATFCTKKLLPRDAADDGDTRAALADRDVEPGNVDPEEREDERGDDRVARVLDGLAALGRARGRAAGAAAAPRGGRNREGGEAGEGEGEDLGEHGCLWGC